MGRKILFGSQGNILEDSEKEPKHNNNAQFPISKTTSFNEFHVNRARRAKTNLAMTYSEENLGDDTKRLATMAASSLMIYCQPRFIKLNSSSPMYCHFTNFRWAILETEPHFHT